MPAALRSETGGGGGRGDDEDEDVPKDSSALGPFTRSFCNSRSDGEGGSSCPAPRTRTHTGYVRSQLQRRRANGRRQPANERGVGEGARPPEDRGALAG